MASNTGVKNTDDDLMALTVNVTEQLLKSGCLTLPVQQLIETMTTEIAAGKLNQLQVRQALGLGINMLLIAMRRLCPVDAEKEGSRLPEDRVREILFYNRLVANLRAEYPLPPHPFTDILWSDCMDARLNHIGLAWADPTPRVDALKDAGGVLLPHTIESFAGGVLLHDISVGFLTQHSDCGLKRLAAERQHVGHMACRETVLAARTHPERIQWILERPEVAERVQAGRLWIVVAEIDTETKKLQQVNRCNLASGEGVWFTPLSLDADAELFQGSPTQDIPEFMKITVN